MADETKYPDVMPKVTNPPNYVKQSSQNKGKKKKKATRRDARNAAKADPVGVVKQIGENQQAVMQTPEAKQRFKDTQDPFKNGFFKNTPQPTFDPAKARNAVDVAKQEQTNAQKLFAPATPDIQTDKAGNKLASKNGMPVGFATGQRKVGDAAPQNPNMASEELMRLGSTDAESAARRGQIKDFAGKFDPATLGERELYRRQKLPGYQAAAKPQAEAVPSAAPATENFTMPKTSNSAEPEKSVASGVGGTIPLKGAIPWTIGNAINGLYGIGDAVANKMFLPMARTLTGMEFPDSNSQGDYQKRVSSYNLPMNQPAPAPQPSAGSALPPSVNPFMPQVGSPNLGGLGDQLAQGASSAAASVSQPALAQQLQNTPPDPGVFHMPGSNPVAPQPVPPMQTPLLDGAAKALGQNFLPDSLFNMRNSLMNPQPNPGYYYLPGTIPVN